MKKLVYHLYIFDGFTENPFTYCNKFCLQRYINIFDEATFFISVDDLCDGDKIKTGIKFVKEVCGDNINTNIFVTKNNKELREVTTFESAILPMIEYGSEDYVFFGHNKGATTACNNELISLLIWVILMYYYNLEFIDDTIRNLDSGKVLYGSNLCDMSYMGIFDYLPSKTFYSGTFYWINTKEAKKYFEQTNTTDFYCNKWIYYAEQFPQFVIDKLKGSYKNNIMTEPQNYNTYAMNEINWREYLLKLDDELQCVPFVNEIIEKVVNIKKNKL